jgi:hypothetical protein
MYPLFRSYGWFLNIKRYDSFPFYVQPGVKSVMGFEDTVLTFIDHLVDAHEVERNKADLNKNPYQRNEYVVRNWWRYSNDTMSNLMFDTKCRKSEYDRLNSVLSLRTPAFYAAATLSHFLVFAYSTYFFRYRRLNKLQVAAVGTAYYYAFGPINNILYKTIVDQKVISTARSMGLDNHVQPNGSTRARGHNF